MEDIKTYIINKLASQGYIDTGMAPYECKTNSIVFLDIAYDMGLHVVEIHGKSVLTAVKDIK